MYIREQHIPSPFGLVDHEQVRRRSLCWSAFKQGTKNGHCRVEVGRTNSLATPVIITGCFIDMFCYDYINETSVLSPNLDANSSSCSIAVVRRIVAYVTSTYITSVCIWSPEWSTEEAMGTLQHQIIVRGPTDQSPKVGLKSMAWLVSNRKPDYLPVIG